MGIVGKSRSALNGLSIGHAVEVSLVRFVPVPLNAPVLLTADSTTVPLCVSCRL